MIALDTNVLVRCLTLDDPGQVSAARALDGYAGGLDFADALHLFSSKVDEGLFTFDAKFASVATAAGHGVHLPGSLPGRPGR